MKKQVLMALVVVVLSFLSIQSFAQAPSVGTAADYTFFTAPAPNLGTAADYVLFTTVGAVGNTGISQITGNVGTNSGAITIYVNVNGVLHTSDGASGQCAADLLIAYNQLNATIPTFFPAPLLGNGQVLNAGVYQITGAATLDNELILDAQNDPNAVFIIQIEGPFSTAANSKVTLVNGALACNVFWKIEGLVDMASGTTMRGTVIANNAAINLSAGVTLEGRALSTAGAVNVTGVLAYTPIGCGSPVLMGPAAPDLVSAACYAIFSGNGSVTNAGITYVTGDVGTNVGLTTGFNPLFVTGMIHPIPDGSTAAAAADLLNAYNFLNVIPYDIELMYPAQFGNNLVLTPHTYLLNAATTLTDTLYLNGGGQADAIFVIKIEGALSTSTYSKVILTNGTLPENVFWNVNGAVSINDYSVFKGTVIANNGTVNLATRVNIDGRAFSTTGAIETTAVTVTMPPGCASALPPEIITDPEDQIACEGDSVSFTVSATGTDLEYQWRKGLVDLADGGNIFGATSDELIINPAGVADAAADYNVVVSGTYPPAVTSENVSLTVETAPEITTQPTDQIASVGGSATFSVIASGDGLTYQWRKGLVDLADGGNISGATSEMLTINPVGLDDVASDYNVVITGNCPPDAISDNASLTISASPVIITEPSNQVVCENGMVSFSVVASGDGLTYQWRKGLVELTDGGNIFGATSDELIINPAGVADAAADYNVVVSGTYSPEAVSVDVSLTVETAPEITTQPTNQIAGVSGSVSFSVAASGDGLSYQWRKGLVDLADGGNISGATSEMLTIDPVGLADAALDYNVVITGNCAPDAISDNASLTISASPVIITEPSNQVVCENGMVSFSVVASGDGLTYQWRKGLVDLADGGNIFGATSDELIINPAGVADAAADYNVVVSGTYPPAVTSENVSLTVETAPEITTQPTDQIASVGGSATFSVLASGDGLTYQWRKGIVDLADGGNISGATSEMLTINPVGLADAALDYNVVITGNCAPDAISDNASLTISASPVIITQPSNQVVCEDGMVSFSVVASGDGLTYQWRKGLVELTDGGNIFGATSDELIINPAGVADAAADYNVVVSGTYPPAVTSENVSLTVETTPEITTQPTDQIASVGGSATFSVIASGDGLTYQWRKGLVDLADGGNISGATSEMLTINPVGLADAALDYNVVITGNCAPDAISDNASLTISASPVIITEPSNQVVCENGMVSFSVVASGDGLTYQWRKGLVELTDGGNIFGATSDELIINPAGVADAAADYNVVVSGTYPPAVTSENVSLTVETAPEITTQPTDQIASVGGSATFSVLASGDGLTYQWRKGIVDLADGGNISGATSEMLTINPVGLADAALDYNVVITGNCAPDAISDNASLTISASPVIITQPSNQVVCEDGMVSFSVVASGDGLTYQWRKGLVELTDGGNIFGATSDELIINPAGVADAAADYNVVVSGTYPPAVTSENVSLTVETTPEITTQPTDQIASVGGSATFSVIASGDGLTYQWRKGLVDLADGGNISGATSEMLTINPVGLADAALDYNVVITGNCAPDAISDNASLTISASPVIITEPSNQVVCENGMVSFSVVASGDGLTYQWRKGLVDLADGGNIFGATSDELIINPAGVADAAADYNVVVSGAYPPADTSENVSLTVQLLPDNVSAGTDIIVCDDVLTIDLTGTASNYASVSWSGGNGFFSDEDLVTSYYVDPADVTAGTITLCMTVIAVAPCQGSVVDCITITFDPSPSISNLQDATICEGDPEYCFTGVTATNYSSLLWSGGDGSFDDPNALNPCYTPGPAEVGDVVLTLTAQPMGECNTPAVEAMTLHIAADPTIGLDDEMYLTCANYDFGLDQWLPFDLAPVVTDASSVLWTTTGDGFFDNPAAALTSYNVGMTDKWNGSVTLTLTANGDVNCGVVAEASIILYIPQQIIEVLPGTIHRGISSYVDKSTTSVAEVMDPVVVVPGSQSLVIMINKEGKYFWPEAVPAINQLGLWQPIGYKAKFKAEGCLPIYGDEPYDVVDQTFAVSGAINYIPCLTNYPAAINTLFAGFEDKILLIYNWEEGTIWVPDPNVISPLNFIRPGSAYMMVNRSGANYSVTFPPFDYTASIVANAAVPPAGTDYSTPWNAAVNTSLPHFILFADEVIGTMQAGDIVGAFDQYNQCVGTTEIGVKNNLIKLLAMGDDPSTESIDGFEESENMTFKLYRPSTGETFDVAFTYDANYPSYDNKFEVYGVSKVAGMTTTLTSLNELVADRSVNVYPNPANQVINIASGYDLRKVTLINYVGQTIFAQVVDGNDFQINVSGFVKGMYFVRIETTQGNIVTKPISIQ